MIIILDTQKEYDLSDDNAVNKLKDNLRKMRDHQQWDRIKVVYEQVKDYEEYVGKSLSYKNARKVHKYIQRLLENEEIPEPEEEKRALPHRYSHKISKRDRPRPILRSDSSLRAPQLEEEMESLSLHSSFKQQRMSEENQLPIKKKAQLSSETQETKKQTPNWKDVACVGNDYDWLSKPAGQIVSVDIYGKVDNRFCSGTNIGKNLFLTAGHCLGDKCYSVGKYSGNYKISFNNQYPDCDKNGKGTGKIREHLYAIQEVVEYGICENIDYAIFRLEPNAEKQFGQVKLCSEMPKFGEKIVLAHYAEGKPQVVSQGEIMASRDTDSEYCLRESSGVCEVALKGDTRHSAHTLGGSSGSGIGHLGQKALIAIHVAGDGHQTRHIGLSIHALVKESKTLRSLSGLQSTKGINQGVSSRSANKTRHPVFGSLQQSSLGLSNVVVESEFNVNAKSFRRS